MDSNSAPENGPAGSPPPGQADALPVLDPAWLERMLSVRPDFLRRLYGIFLADEPARVAAMGQAISSADMDLLRHLAHSLKGASATLGMPRVSQACRALEFAARDGCAPDIPALHEAVAREMEAVYAAIRTVMPPD